MKDGPWRIDKRHSLWQSLSGVSLTSNLFCAKNQFSLVDETPEEGIYDNWIPFEGSVFRQIGKFRESFSMHFLFFKCLQLKMINIPPCYILVWCVLLPFTSERRFTSSPLTAYLISEYVFITISTIHRAHAHSFLPSLHSLWIPKELRTI